MKTLNCNSIRTGAGINFYQRTILLAAAAVLGCLTLQAQPYPAELLKEKAAFNNTAPDAIGAGQSAAIEGEYAVVAGNKRLDGYRLVNGEWEFQGGSDFTWQAAEDSLAAHNGTITAGQATGNGAVYVFQAKGDEQSALNGWNVTDTSQVSGSTFGYLLPFTPEQLDLATNEVWTLTVVSRMNDNFGDSASLYFDFADTNDRRFLIFFDLDDNKDLTVQLSGLETLTLTTNGAGWGAYHTHQIIFDPVTQTADYHFDGVKMNSAPWSPTAVAGLNGLRFGAGSSGGRGSVTYNKVEFLVHEGNQILASYDAGDAGNPADPDPVDQGWNAFGTGTGVSTRAVQAELVSIWPLTGVARAADDSSGANFGASVDISGDTMVVGAYGDNDYSGAAYVFTRDGDAWNQQQKLTAAVPRSNNYYGYNVAIDGDNIVVGSLYYESLADPTSGLAFVWVRDGATWSQQDVLNPATATSPSQYMSVQGVDVSGDLAIVGTPSGGSQRAGAVSVFRRTGTAWAKESVLNPGSNYATVANFGGKVAIHDGTVFAGFNRSSETGINPQRYFASYLAFSKDGADGWVPMVQHDYEVESIYNSVTGIGFDGVHLIISFYVSPNDDVEPVHVWALDYSDAGAVAQFVRKLTDYTAAKDSGNLNKDSAAFRYKDLLYGKEDLKMRSRTELMNTLYGEAERARAAYAESELAKGLVPNPDDVGLRDLMLDIYYDRTVAETILGKDLLATAEKAHFGGLIGIDPPLNGFVIDQEIPPYQQALAKQRETVDGLLSLLGEDFGAAVDPPLGYQMFRDRVPFRALMSARYTNELGDSVSVSSEEILFTGYKDAVLAFDQLRDYGQTAATVGKLMIARDNPAAGNQMSDRDQVRALITGAQQYLYVHGHLVKDLFPNLPPPGDESGLAEAIAGWEGSLTDLEGLQQLLAGDANVLGFASDFMMYIQNFGTQTTPEFHSYDIFRERLDPARSNSALKLGLDDLQAAQDSYLSFRGFEDQLAANFSGSSITYRDRLRDIVGVFPDSPDYGDDPTRHPGSELEQQYRSIQAARLRILKNKTEIQNVRKQVRIERDRAANASEVYIRYGNERASIEQKIGEIEATQATADQLTDYFNPANLISGASIAIAFNFGVQTITELDKAQLNAQKERLAAMESAEIDGVNSDAMIKNLLLQLNTLAVDSMEAALLLTQEANRFAGLYREKRDLEREIAEQDEALAARFFADPIHRQVMQTNMLSAEISFQTAQKWLYFTVRALQYKHNIPFIYEQYTPESIFKLRNARELEDFYFAMDQFDQLKNLGDPERRDMFSVREDFFGYVKTNRFGQALLYPDPVTGQQVSAVAAFRSRLHQLQDGQGTVGLNFSTVRQKAGGFFFQGPNYDPDGNPIPSTGRYLDKIRSISIRLPGNHTLGQAQISGNLTYGGTSFIRNAQVGTLDPGRPDQLVGEMTPYSTRVWFFDTAGGLNRWNFKENLKVNGVALDVIADNGSVPAAGEIVEFKERSVAATGWVLEIPTISVGTLVMDVDELNDIELHFWHYSASR